MPYPLSDNAVEREALWAQRIRTTRPSAVAPSARPRADGATRTSGMLRHIPAMFAFAAAKPAAAAARYWWKTPDEYLRKIGFKATVVDPCLYYRWIEDKYWLTALVVDDMILATNDTTGRFGTELGKRFEVKDMGDLTWCLGLQISRSRLNGYIFCSQEAYCKKILRDFTKHLKG